MSDPTHSPNRRGAASYRWPTGWRSRLPVAALAFVAVSLVALAVMPLVTSRQLEVMRDVSGRTTNAAEAIVTRLRILIAEEIVAHQALRARADTTALRRYRAFRDEEDSLVAVLETVAPLIGPEVVLGTQRLRDVLDRHAAANDERADGRMTDARFLELLPGLRVLRDSVIASQSQLAHTIERVEAGRRARGGRVIARERRVTSALGLLAVVAVVVLAWLGRRERRLTRALAAAVEEEARLRAVAEQRREDLARMSESKARLMRGFSHDVKNPLGAADGFMALLEEGVMGPLAEKQQRSVERARRSIKAALNLIGDLLELAKAEAGTIEVKLATTDVRDVAREAAEEFRAQAEAKGLAMQIDLRGAAIEVHTDPVRVRQVLGNLISNAVKYTPQGAVTVRMADGRAAPASADGRGCVGIEVSDSGAGIPPEKMRLLFQEFVRLDPRAGPGVGIGLAISHRIVKALGGDITVESEPGRGSTFVLWLPAGAPAAAASPQRGTAEVPAAFK